MDTLDISAIPIKDKFIIYRPLLRLAFVGNRPMADLALKVASQESLSTAGVPEDVATFLEAIGFLQPDPSPPSPMDTAYHPATAVLLMTNRCNLRCTYCYAAGGEGPVKDLTPELAQVVIDRVYQNAVDQGQPGFELTFHGGGEPVTAWDTLRKATRYARGKDLACHVSLVSNGVWTARQREWLLHNMDNLSISFDGRQETQDRQRPSASGRGSFKAVMRTIAALDQNKFPYGIRMTATAPWRERLPEDVRFICQETDCPAMQVEPAFNTRRGEHQSPTQEESEAFTDAFMEAFEIAQQAGRQLVYSGARPWLLAQAFCTAPYGALIVNAAGSLVACYEVASHSHPLAHMSSMGRVVDSQIVENAQAREALMLHLEEKRARCRGCFCYWHCAGDCYTRSFFAETAESPSPRCAMNREITARILLWYIMAGDGVWRGQDINPQETQLLQAF